jgi:GAF domain-containing protein
LSYADLTWEDPNPVKRWLQRRRVADALAQVPAAETVSMFVDYGGGDGFLAVQALERWPEAEAVVFEPYGDLAEAARRRLGPWTQARVVEHQRDLPEGADVVFCTEVFEHLPGAETERAIWEIDRVLKVGGRLVVGVPVEIGLPALLKGLFRRARRPQAYDGDWSRIWKAALGRPATDRPLERMGERLRYHPFHLGFDHRPLRRRLEAQVGLCRLSGSPLAIAPVSLSSEAYMTLIKPETPPMAHIARDDRPADKAERYREVAEEIQAVLAGETNRTARMATVASMLADAFPSFIWTGFYQVDEGGTEELVVGPYQGKLGCLRIPFGRGVCGTAAQARQTQVIEDVHAFDGHIACDSRSRSEIVVPVFDPEQRLIAVLDIDSADYGTFDAVDAEALEHLIRALFATADEARADRAGAAKSAEGGRF